VDFIAVPCNSAAIFVPEVQQQLRIPVLNICKLASDALAVAYPGTRRAAAIGAYVTYEKKTYAHFLAAHGIELVDHGQRIQRRVVEIIESLKLGKADPTHVRTVQELAADLRDNFQVDAMILACTEFACLPRFDAVLPIVDSSIELAKHTVSLCLG
jgi:aspartate racemase